MCPYFRCKGSTQHLKSTYGGGYVLEADVEPSTADIFDDDAIATQQKHVNELICGRLFVDARCTEQFGRHCVYQIPRTSVLRLSEVFSALQQSKTTLFSFLACAKPYISESWYRKYPSKCPKPTGTITG